MILDLVLAASIIPATIYGVKGPNGAYERMCGDIGKAVECGPNAVTASGVKFSPYQPHVAVPAPKRQRLRKGIKICFLTTKGAKVYLPLTDKKKWEGGQGGFDFSAKAVEMLGFKATRYWSSKVKLCPHIGVSAL